MEQETKLPEGLELAQLCCMHASFTGVPDADARTAHEAIRAEHALRMTLQHHAADMAQRVAGLEAERDAAQQARRDAQALAERYQAERNAAGVQARREVGEQVRKLTAERDELRARLAEIERQEPVAWLAPAEVSEDWPWPHALFAADAHPHIRELMEAFPVYANPVPAIPEGWKLAPVKPTREQWVAGGTAAREYMEETGRNNPAVIYTAMIAAAPEHKA